jgi:hypothetical protein
MARKYHPDRGGTSQRMKEINEAYEVLSDTARKSRYDMACKEKQRTSGGSAGTSYRSGYYHRQWQSGQGTESSYSSYSGASRSRESQGNTGYQQARRSPTRGQKLMSWPSWKWQRIALIASLPIALFLIYGVQQQPAGTIGAFLLISASYACAKTGCLTRVKEYGGFTKLTGRFAIVMGVVGIGLAATILVAPFFLIALLIEIFVPKKERMGAR